MLLFNGVLLRYVSARGWGLAVGGPGAGEMSRPLPETPPG